MHWLRSEAEEGVHALLVVTLLLGEPLLLGLLGQRLELGHHPGVALGVERDTGGRRVGRAVEHVSLQGSQGRRGVDLLGTR